MIESALPIFVYAALVLAVSIVLALRSSTRLLDVAFSASMLCSVAYIVLESIVAGGPSPFLVFGFATAFYFYPAAFVIGFASRALMRRPLYAFRDPPDEP